MAYGWKLLFLGLVLSVASVSAAGKCKVCDSSNDKCAATPQDVTTDCEATECYTSVDIDGKIKRGCVDDTNKCDTENCKKCTAATDACNIKIPFTCKTCDSSVNANCSKAASTFANKICDEGITKCLVQLKTDKHTERRCVTKNDETCTAGGNCEICSTSGCNKEIFPAGRLRCYQCEASAACANPWANPAEVISLPCTIYDPSDKCYVYGTAADSMARGCASDAAYSKCTDAKEKCKQCSTNSCNQAAYTVSQSLKCIQCQEQDEDCPWGYEESAAKVCVNQIEYWQDEACYTRKITGDKAQRGCLHDAKDLDCTEANSCTSCNSADGCNKADVMEFSCYKCRSTENTKCALELKDGSFSTGKCRNPVTKADQGCYTEKWNDIVIRSCLVDADYETRKNCLDSNYKLCTSCTEKDCNKLAPPNSSQRAGVAISLLGVTYFVLRFL